MNTPRRDLGLDALRVVALFLMVAVHSSRRFPSSSSLIELLKFIGESAPAFFFFAFGLTFARFQSKPTMDRIEVNLMFMYVGLAHNLFTWDALLIPDFLFFLFLARIGVDAMGSLRNERAAYLTVSAGTMLLALAFPAKGVIDKLVGSAIYGPFPLFPWIVFVLLGAAYATWAPARRQAVFLGCSSIAVAIALSAAAEPLGRTSLEIRKWPLTTPYILLFTGASILLLEGVRHIQGAVRARTWLSNPMVYVSKNLLLATVLQYPALELLFWAQKYVGILRPVKGDETAALVAILLAAIACQLLLLAMLPLMIALWDRCKGMLLFENLRHHRALVAIGLLGGATLVSTTLARDSLAMDFLARPWKIVAFTAMIYFTLELREWQFRKRSEA